MLLRAHGVRGVYPRATTTPDEADPRERTIRSSTAWPRVRPLLALAGLALVVTGCSGADEAAPGRSPGPTTPAPTASATALPTPASPSPTPARTASAAPRPTPTRATGSPSAGPEDPLAPASPLESAPAAPGLPTCSASDLSVTDADAVYTSTSVQELFTVRTSGADCQLQGYPTVQLLDAAGAPVPGTVEKGGPGLPGPSGGALSLSRTTSLSFFVSTARDGTCLPVATVVVGLPGAGAPLRASTALQVCAGAVAVGPVQRLGDAE